MYETDDGSVLQELERLVAAEQGCCGAAGVEFELDVLPDRVCVVVKTVKDGLPAETVVAAFAGMTPS